MVVSVFGDFGRGRRQPYRVRTDRHHALIRSDPFDDFDHRPVALSHPHLAAGERLEVANDTIGINDVQVQRKEKQGVDVAVEGNLCVGLDLQLNEELVREGLARELVNRVQNLRKDVGLDVADRIRVWFQGDPELTAAAHGHSDYIAADTLAVEVHVDELPEQALLTQDRDINGATITIAIERA